MYQDFGRQGLFAGRFEILNILKHRCKSREQREPLELRLPCVALAVFIRYGFVRYCTNLSFSAFKNEESDPGTEALDVFAPVPSSAHPLPGCSHPLPRGRALPTGSSVSRGPGLLSADAGH